MTHDELIEALDAATGPSRELDFWLWWHGKANKPPGCDVPSDHYVKSNIKHHNAPRYTSVTDDARALIPTERDGDVFHHPVVHVYYEQRQFPRGLHRYELVEVASRGRCWIGETRPDHDPTGALALCIAAMKAQRDLGPL